MTPSRAADTQSPGSSAEPQAAFSGDTATTPPAERQGGLGGFFTELPILVGVAFVLALVMKTFLVQAFFIPSSSMEPTLLIDDRVLVNKVVYELRDPRRGEIVVFSENDGLVDDAGIVERAVESLTSGLGFTQPVNKDFIKRIVGLPGDELEMREGLVYVNGEPLPEAPVAEGGYLAARDFGGYGPVTVPEGEYFMMGDNRPSSADSRSSLGTIPRVDIVGKAFVVIFPFDRLNGLASADYGGGFDVGAPR